MNEDWHKSSYSGYNGDCLQARLEDGMVRVRDSKNPDGPVIEFTPREWEDFLAGAKAGEFNLPADSSRA